MVICSILPSLPACEELPAAELADAAELEAAGLLAVEEDEAGLDANPDAALVAGLAEEDPAGEPVAAVLDAGAAEGPATWPQAARLRHSEKGRRKRAVMTPRYLQGTRQVAPACHFRRQLRPSS
ncbi:MAG TPA: hypothetical protein VK009_20535 [Chloroflexota bacterium]|nr:hypothetical protein [Chloroflexota bacterium]